MQRSLFTCSNKGRLHSSPAKLRSKLRDVHPSVHGVQRTNTQIVLPSTLHLPAPNVFFGSMQRRGPHHDQGSYQVQTSRTIMKVRRSAFKILNMDTRKATTNTQNTRTRRRSTHITKKHCATKCAPWLDCSSTTLSVKNATTTSEYATNATTTSTRAPALLIPPVETPLPVCYFSIGPKVLN